MDDFWHSISEIADRASRDTGKTITQDYVFELARRDVFRIGARIPALDGEDIGELQWHYPDGSQVGQVGYGAIRIDGMAPWLETNKLDTLAMLGQVTLSGARWPKSGCPTLTAGPDSRYIKRDALRVPETEYPRILAAINGEPSTPREIKGTAPTPARHAAEPWWHLIQQDMELNEHIAEVGKAKSNLQQSRQDLAILRDELSQLEANPAFLSAGESYVADLELRHEANAKGGQKELIEQSAARIKDWSARLARLRLQTSKATAVEVHPSDEQTNSVKGDADNGTDVNGMVAWQAEILERWSEIKGKRTKKLSPLDVMRWLKEFGRQDRICKDQIYAESLCWIDRDGRTQVVMKSTIGNRLSVWRKEGKI